MGSFSIDVSQPIGVLVADSNQIHSQLLVEALRRRSDFRVNSCNLDIDAMVQAVTKNVVDVALVKADGDLDELHAFHLAHPHIAKVLLFEGDDPDLTVNAFRSGARGVFQMADSSVRMLCKCISRVHQGQIWASNRQLSCLIDALAQLPGLRVVNSHGIKLLTPREEQVVALVADGLPNRDIALEMGVTENTVKKYLFYIFDKVGVSSRVELVLYAVSHGVAQQVQRLPS